MNDELLLEPLDPAFVFSLLVPGSLSALAALVLRRAEDRVPDPEDWEVRGGLDHMMVGLIAGAALFGFVFLSLAMLGIFPALAILAAMMGLIRAADFGDRLIPYYRLQMSLAVAALIAALILWVATIQTIQGVPNA